MENETGYRQIEWALGRVNYRRRTRTISMRDVAQVLREALHDGVGYHSGGTVARSYDYPASTAAVAAVRLDGSVAAQLLGTVMDSTFAIKFGSHDAHRNASQVTWFGPHSCREADLMAWRAKQTIESLREDDWIILARRDVVQVIRSQRHRYNALLENVPLVTVTREHSLAAGNCRTETDRIATVLGVDKISSRRLLTYLAHHEPHLLPYARRAVDYAAEQEEIA